MCSGNGEGSSFRCRVVVQCIVVHSTVIVGLPLSVTGVDHTSCDKWSLYRGRIRDHTRLRLHGAVGVHRQHHCNSKNQWQGGSGLPWPYHADDLATERERTAPCGVSRKRADAAVYHQRVHSVIANHDAGQWWCQIH